MKKRTLFIAFILAGFTAQAQIDCTKPGHVGETAHKVESSTVARDTENVFVSITTSHWICSQQNSQYAWVPHQALGTRQKTGADNVTYTFNIKKSVAYLATQNYKHFKTVDLANSSIQTTHFQLSAADVAADAPAGKLQFFLRTYGRVEFSDGRVIDPMVENSRARIIDITK